MKEIGLLLLCHLKFWERTTTLVYTLRANERVPQRGPIAAERFSSAVIETYLKTIICIWTTMTGITKCSDLASIILTTRNEQSLRLVG